MTSSVSWAFPRPAPVQRRRAVRALSPAAACAAAAAGAAFGAQEEAHANVRIEPAVGAQVTQNLLLQLDVVLSFPGVLGGVASLSVPSFAQAANAAGADLLLPVSLQDGPVSDDTATVNVEGVGESGEDGPYRGAILVMVQFN